MAGGGAARVRLRVAVADVVSRVAQGAPIDEHAWHNTTSVYTTGKTFHMLPERLSTELTSLVPREERLAMVVLDGRRRRGCDHGGRDDAGARAEPRQARLPGRRRLAGRRWLFAADVPGPRRWPPP